MTRIGAMPTPTHPQKAPMKTRLMLVLPCLCAALTGCGSTVESDNVAGAVATTLVKIPFFIVGGLLDGDDDHDSSDSSIGKRHVARQSSDNQPLGVR